MTNKKRRSVGEIRKSIEEINQWKPSKEALIELANIINANSTPNNPESTESLLKILSELRNTIKERQDQIDELEKNNHVMKMRIADLTFALEESRKGDGEI